MLALACSAPRCQRSACRQRAESLAEGEGRHSLDGALDQVPAGLRQLPGLVGRLPPLAASHVLLTQAVLEDSQVRAQLTNQRYFIMGKIRILHEKANETVFYTFKDEIERKISQQQAHSCTCCRQHTLVPEQALLVCLCWSAAANTLLRHSRLSVCGCDLMQC